MTMTSNHKPHVEAHEKPLDVPAPSVEEPTTPQEPLPAPGDQLAPQMRTATGVDAGRPPSDRAQQGPWLTTAQGLRLRDTDHSLKAGRRGPTLLQDHHLREKIMHFDHERIPERVVHARGAGAHGRFTSNGAASTLTRAEFLKPGVETPVFVRFSTVLGSRGSADTPRDTRGFATKFYTSEGVYDLVANNIPVFFIQDGIKFPDVIHAGKPEPDREIPQAASAHDTFWDFVSLHTEAQHHTLWNMSDRALPLSLRTMEGFGIHTFRFIAEDGSTSLVKFHWKPKAGVHSQLWEEAQLTAGKDPDFQRRDLADAIQNGAFPEWDLGIQVFPDNEEQMFEGIDLLDPTKLVPEELAPVEIIGTMVLDANPTNYFAETEQVAFHPGHLVPGIDVTNDPLLQARLFSYLDTQITRLGGPNFSQIPINRPHAPINDMLRDGFHQDAVPAGKAPYRPNSLDGGCPFKAGEDVSAFIDHPQVVEGSMVREHSASFDDHFSQPRMFFRSLTPVEQDHVIGGYAFELSKVTWPQIRERQVKLLVTIDEHLGTEVAKRLGLEVPTPLEDVEIVEMPPSPALRQVREEAYPVAGRRVGILADGATSLTDLEAVVDTVTQAGAMPLVVGPHAGRVECAGGDFSADKTFFSASSIEFDALVLLSSFGPAEVDPRVQLLVEEAYRHGKPLGAVGQAGDVVEAAGIAGEDAGIVVAPEATGVTEQVLELLGHHRVWERLARI